MTREDIIECLTHSKKSEHNRKLLAFCEEPKTYTEMRKWWSGLKEHLFDALVELKKAEAVAFADGKYFATQLGLEVLNSS